jgi:hypothetical protein
MLGSELLSSPQPANRKVLDQPLQPSMLNKFKDKAVAESSSSGKTDVATFNSKPG